jgi:hypothetical protein
MILWYVFVSFDRSEIPTHKERAHFLLTFSFRVEYFYFHVPA